MRCSYRAECRTDAHLDKHRNVVDYYGPCHETPAGEQSKAGAARFRQNEYGN